MSEDREFKDRREEAEYYDTHEITEEDTEEVDVQVKRPLSAMISVRMDHEHLDKLKLLARANDVGVTTMARKLLYMALDDPSKQLFFKALNSDSVRQEIGIVLEESQAGTRQDPKFFVFSAQHLEYLGDLINQTTRRLFLEAMMEQSFAVTPEEQRELYEKLVEEAHR